MNSKEFNRLVNRIKYDTNAIDTLYNYYFRRIVWHLKQQGYHLELAKDVAQEFFIFLLSHNIGYIQCPTAWIYTCCNRMAARKANSSHIVTVELAETAVFDKYDYTDDYAILYNAVLSMDVKIQQILKLHYWYGYTHKEIAERLNISATSVRQKHFQAIRKLRKILKNID